MDDDYRKLMQEQDWERISLEILHYCVSLFKRDGKSESQVIARGHLAEDVAAKAIYLVLSGERRWDPKRGELIPFIKCSVIRNLRSNAYKLKENSIVDCLDAYCGAEGNETFQKRNVTEGMNTPSAEEMVLATEDLSVLLHEFKDAVGEMNSEDAQNVFDCLIEGITKPREIETLTGVPARRISELKRQIKDRMRGASHE